MIRFRQNSFFLNLILKGSTVITPLSRSFRMYFLIWLRFSKLKKYLEFFSPCWYHLARDLIIIPSTFLSYMCSIFSFKVFKVDKFSWLGLFWKAREASWNSLFICHSSAFIFLILFIEYCLEYFLTLYFTQSQTERGSLRSCLPSWSRFTVISPTPRFAYRKSSKYDHVSFHRKHEYLIFRSVFSEISGRKTILVRIQRFIQKSNGLMSTSYQTQVLLVTGWLSRSLVVVRDVFCFSPRYFT